MDKSGAVGQRVITLGVDSEARIEVLSGLSDGDQVIVGNLNAVQAGQHVRSKLVAQNELGAEGQF